MQTIFLSNSLATLLILLGLNILYSSMIYPASTSPNIKKENLNHQFSNLGINLKEQKWWGYGLCYSGYRRDESPLKKIYPSKAEIFEDFKLLLKHEDWRIIRTYSCDKHSRDILEVIKEKGLNIKVMLGAWLIPKQNGKTVSKPLVLGHQESENEKEVAECIRLANLYPQIVVAISIGNESLADWSNHKISEDEVIALVKKTRLKVKVPVTVDDDITYWQHGKKLAQEVDFVSLHVYPYWAHVKASQAVEKTIEYYERIKKALPPNTIIVLGEVGWPTWTAVKYDRPKNQNIKQASTSAQAQVEQLEYFSKINTWAYENKITIFYFEAFDESWKGPGVDSSWGLFTIDREPKLAMRFLKNSLPIIQTGKTGNRPNVFNGSHK